MTSGPPSRSSSTEPWQVSVWIKPTRGPQRQVLRKGFWKSVGQADTTEDAIAAVRGIIKETGSVAQAVREAPKGEPIEIYGSRHSFAIKRFV